MKRMSRAAIVCLVLVTNVGAPWLQHWHATDCFDHASRSTCPRSRPGETEHDHAHHHAHDPRTNDSPETVASSAGADQDTAAHVAKSLQLASGGCGSAHDPQSCTICRHFSQGQWHSLAQAPTVAPLRRETATPSQPERIVRKFDAFSARGPPSC